MHKAKSIVVIIVIFSFALFFMLSFSYYHQDSTVGIVDMQNVQNFSSLASYEIQEDRDFYKVTHKNPSFFFMLPSETAIEEEAKNNFQGLKISSQEEDCLFYFSVYEDNAEFAYLAEKISLLAREKITREEGKLFVTNGKYGYKNYPSIKFLANNRIYSLEEVLQERTDYCKELFFYLINSLSIENEV
jgi:hypothetical protein